MDLEEETSPGSPTILNSLRDTQSKKVLRRAAIALAINAMLQRTLPAGFITPCLPTKTDKLPSGSGWLHEIKHDGFGSLPARMADR